MKRTSILLLILVTSLTAATAWAGSRIVYVPAPNGSDDTANIQAALDACVAYGKGCTVQLQAGTYLTKQVVEYNFQGTFKGMGMDITTIEALPNLYTNEPDYISTWCQPNLTTCIWSALFSFVDGNISVSDLTVTVPAVPATTVHYGGGIPLTMLDPLEFTGQYPTDVTIDRIRVEGAPSNLSTDWGYNVANLIHYSGYSPAARLPTTGTS